MKLHTIMDNKNMQFPNHIQERPEVKIHKMTTIRITKHILLCLWLLTLENVFSVMKLHTIMDNKNTQFPNHIQERPEVKIHKMTTIRITKHILFVSGY